MERAAIAGLVEKCLTAKQCDARTDTSELASLAEAVAKVEVEIDAHVYALYGLTPEEIQIVEATLEDLLKVPSVNAKIAQEILQALRSPPIEGLA